MPTLNVRQTGKLSPTYSHRIGGSFMWLLYVSCTWVAGIFLGSKISLPLFAFSFGLIPFALIPFLRSKRNLLIVVGLCLSTLLGGVLHFPSNLPPLDENSLYSYNDLGIVDIQGMVAEEPDMRDRYCLLTFSASEIIINGEKEEVSGIALVRIPRYPTYRYGDALKVTGLLESPPQFEDFDYKSYLYGGENIQSTASYPSAGRMGWPARGYTSRSLLRDTYSERPLQPRLLGPGTSRGTRIEERRRSGKGSV